MIPLLAVTAPNGFRQQIFRAAMGLPHLKNLGLMLIAFIFLINMRSWPFAWHVRIFKPAVILKLNHLWIWSGIESEEEVLVRVSPVGANPFEYEVKYTSRAFFDDCDFHFHMSNSAYAKAVDASILKTILRCFPTFLALGGWMPVTGTTFLFRHQIPLLVQYEIRMRIATWDHKWIYFVSEFVTRGKGEVVPISEKLLYSYNADDGSVSSDSGGGSKSIVNLQKKSNSNAIAITKMCFKIGRITVPPAIVLASSGFCSPNTGVGGDSSPYSHENPPPHFRKVREVMSSMRCDPKQGRAFYTSGWKNLAKEDRWWEQALVGLEQRRKEGLRYTAQVMDAIEGLERLSGGMPKRL